MDDCNLLHLTFVDDSSVSEKGFCTGHALLFICRKYGKRSSKDHKTEKPHPFCFGFVSLRFPCFHALLSFALISPRSMENHSENTTKSGKHPPPPPLCMSVWKSLSPLLVCNASCGLSTKYVCEHVSHLFDVPVVTMTFLFVIPNSIDTICSGHDAVP